MNNSKADYQEELISYLDIYLKKRGLNMKPVIRNIKKDLKKGYNITPRQFASIVKFLEREIKFINRTRDEITNYFKLLIINDLPKSEPRKPTPDKLLHNLDTIFEGIQCKPKQIH